MTIRIGALETCEEHGVPRMECVYEIHKPKENPVTTERITPAAEAQKPAIARELVANADKRGWVNIGVPDIERRTGIPGHDVTHALWDFSKRGLMKFREVKATTSGPTQSHLTALRLTSSGRRTLSAMAKQPVVEQAVVEQPVEVDSAEAIEQRFMVRLVDYAILTKFPLIAGLVRRREMLVEAADLLEKAGDETLALAALERSQSTDLFTPLEAEAVALWEAINLGKQEQEA